jgi:hypothetical protein
MSTAEESLRYADLFEAELLVELMLRFWKHPLADDEEFRNGLLESAVEALRAAINGDQLLEGLAPSDMNLVAAVWYVEWNSLMNAGEGESEKLHAREQWLDLVRRSIPSCFCDPDDLP